MIDEEEALRRAVQAVLQSFECTLIGVTWLVERQLKALESAALEREHVGNVGSPKRRVCARTI